MPMARFARTTANPALDAAGLLRRLGFFLLAVAAPLLAVTSRRGLVIVAPIGIALMVLAAVLESEGQEPLSSLRRSVGTLGGAVAAFLVFWATLSLLWAPFPSEALDRIVNIIGMGIVGLAAAAAVPQRMRASNLYLLPIGCALAAIAALVIVLDPELVVVGSSFLGNAEMAIPGIQQRLSGRIIRVPRVEAATFRDDAVLIGVAELATTEVNDFAYLAY
jgi:hypothetical protein